MTSCYLFQFNTDNLSMQINLKDDTIIDISILDYKNNDYEVNDNNLFFKEIWNNSDLEYKFLEDSIKENIYLKSPDCPREFKFKLNCTGKPIIDNGNILFINENGELIYSIQKPFIIKDEKVYDYEEIVSHNFDSSSNIYSIKLHEISESLFPLIIDPNFLFPSSKYAKGSVYGGISKTKTIVVGSNINNQPLDFSNKIAHLDKPNEIIGSDLVTFNRNVNVFLDLFKKDGAKNLNINSITISSSNHFKNLFDNQYSSINENTEVQLSAILMYIMRSEPDKEYSIYFDFKKIPPNTISITNNVSLVLDSRSTDSLPDQYGVLSEISSNNNNRFDFTYTAPSDMEDLEYVLIKIDSIIEHTLNGEAVKTVKTSFIYLQFINNLYDFEFEFKNNSAKLDFINSDLYLPTNNRGLVIIDSSLGIIRTIDENSLLPTNALDVYCANRIGTLEDPKGLLLCTEDGIYYFCNKPIGNPNSENQSERPDFKLDPYREPTIYGIPIKISNLKIIDFIMSDIFLFLLTKDSKILKFTYKTFLYNLINKPLNINNELNTTSNGIIDLSNINDRYIELNEDKINVFHISNFFDKENNIQYNSPYMPKEDFGPKKLLPIAVDSDNRFLQSSERSIMESAYFTHEQKKLYGFTVLYNQKEVDNS